MSSGKGYAPQAGCNTRKAQNVTQRLGVQADLIWFEYPCVLTRGYRDLSWPTAGTAKSLRFAQKCQRGAVPAPMQ